MARQDRVEFAERLRRQVQARYPGVAVGVVADRFALQLLAPGIDATIPLTPLSNAISLQPAETSRLIAEFVATVERQLTPRTGNEFSLGRVVWCVRSQRYIDDLGRPDELILREIAADLVAFVAELLPNSAMRGVAMSRLAEANVSREKAIAAADTATRERFSGLAARIAATDRVPGDGWQFSSDVLFQGSMLVVPEIIGVLTDRVGGDILLANPDRALVLALPGDAESKPQFSLRVTREWREAMNPVSREVVVARRGGAGLTAVARRRGGLMPWLSE